MFCTVLLLYIGACRLSTTIDSMTIDRFKVCVWASVFSEPNKKLSKSFFWLCACFSFSSCQYCYCLSGLIILMTTLTLCCCWCCWCWLWFANFSTVLLPPPPLSQLICCCFVFGDRRLLSSETILDSSISLSFSWRILWQHTANGNDVVCLVGRDSGAEAVWVCVCVCVCFCLCPAR